ncbi:MAG: DUF6879 family protein [Dermatophilaceae bacterium]
MPFTSPDSDDVVASDRLDADSSRQRPRRRRHGSLTDLDDPAWLGLFESVQESWFRLETLQVYDVEYEREEFELFLSTGRFDREPGSWQRMLTRHAEAGRSLRRVHVVEEPLTDYLRYEIEQYRQHSAAGEDIRLISVSSSGWPADIPRIDFWLFDDREVWDMHYDEAGRFVKATRSPDFAQTSAQAGAGGSR